MALPIYISVTGGGSVGANGDYIPVTGNNSIYNGATQFTNGTDFLCYVGGASAWAIYTAVAAVGILNGNALYSTAAGSATSFPLTGWSVVASYGTAPVPVFALLPPSINVFGAGTTAANGNYVPVIGGNATFNGATQYTNGTDFLVLGASAYWYVYTAVNSGGTNLYTNSGGSITNLPFTGWSSSSGAAPAPTLSMLPLSIAVSGGGSTAGNGTYTPVSGSNMLLNGAIQYTNGADFLAYSLYSSPQGLAWMLHTVVNGTFQSTPLYTTANTAGGGQANNNGTAETFPITQWAVTNGTAPVPTFSTTATPAPPSPGSISGISIISGISSISF